MRKTYTETLIEELAGLPVEAREVMAAVSRAKKRVSASFICARCNQNCNQWYMVKNEVWGLAMPSTQGLLHLQCLEELIGRTLTLDDLSGASVNDVVRHFRGRV